jgi:hypothetical protein
MNAPMPYKSARLYDSDKSTVETELSTVEDKKEEEEKDKFTACSTCGAKYKFPPISKVPEDIFPPPVAISTVFTFHQATKRTFIFIVMISNLFYSFFLLGSWLLA